MVKEQYRPIIKEAALSAGAIGIPGAFSFGLDVAAMTGIWTTMTVSIAKASGHKVDRTFIGKLVAALVGGVAAYVGGSKLAMAALHAIPGAGTLTAVGVNSFLNFWYTWRVGRALAILFDREDFSLDDVSKVAKDLLAGLTALPHLSDLGEVVAELRGSVARFGQDQ
jgi:uncharacterized protein (DUF697 family)